MTDGIYISDFWDKKERLSGISLKEHAVDTGTMISEMEPGYVGLLTLMLEPGARYDNLVFLNELSKISTSRRDDLESLVDTTMDTIMTTLDIDVGEYFYQDAKNRNYRLLYKRGHKLSRSILEFTKVTPGQGLVSEAIAKKTPYVLKANELNVVNGSKATQVRLNYSN